MNLTLIKVRQSTDIEQPTNCNAAMSKQTYSAKNNKIETKELVYMAVKFLRAIR